MLFKLESGGFAYMTRVEGENTRLTALFGAVAPQNLVLLARQWRC